jgi:hypothetical protein
LQIKYLHLLILQFDMATDAKKPTAPKPRDAVSWSSLQMVAFTLIGALSATVLSNYGPLSTSNPQTEIVEIGVPVEAGNVSPVTEAAPKIKILSFDPFIAHIADFISPSEREHLLKLGYATPIPDYSLHTD